MRIKITEKYATTTEREFYQQKKIARVLKGLISLIKTDPPRVADRTLVSHRLRAAERLLKEVE